MDFAAKTNLIVIDLSVKRTSPAGSCVLSELIGLSDLYNIHLIASEADASIQKYARFYKIDAPNIPLVFRYMVFAARVKSKINRLLKQLDGPYLIQTTQGQFIDSTVSYAHFCHRAYLEIHWKTSTVGGFRRIARKINHLYHARMEERAFHSTELIVVPSNGLRLEIIEFYPFCRDKVKVISNPVDVEYFKKPADFNKAKERKKLRIDPDEVVIAFAALGDFARKGLPELIRSLKERSIENTPFKILVIGGKPDEIARYQKLSIKVGIENKIIFTGFQSDIRTFLWASDIFSMPSLYETFSLVCAQAATAGLPLLVTQLHGVEEYLVDGKNGWLIERNIESIAAVLKDIGNKKYDLPKMGSVASESVKQYDHQTFRKKWLDVYSGLKILP